MLSRARQVRAKHQILLDDAIRMHAYRAAMIATVRPGDIVADLGCGLGALSVMACDAGAARVHAVEVEPTTLALARQEIARSPYRDRIHLHAGLAQTLRIPERVDVVVSETFGSFGLDENLLPLMRTARTRWLKPGGRLLPCALTLHAVPITARAGTHTLQHHPADLPRTVWLGEPASSPSLDLTTARRNLFDWRTTLTCTTPGQCTGVGLWFTAALTPDIRLTTAPDAPPTHWRQGLLPLCSPVLVQENTRLAFHLRIGPDPTQLETIIEYACALH